MRRALVIAFNCLAACEHDQSPPVDARDEQIPPINGQDAVSIGVGFDAVLASFTP